ncbi:hypothetical protein [Lentzea flaviverrucosa]|uniref:Uncharacterized protein n=1 Tax=Lentzea flaviverrucosa TaxID=200379 RepID=A0A1H9CCW6_9PSEU|nr:hypothetical protein [Lentzea flaviverrucosa]RDI24513.1 hypothetical protein DFR72_10993 [Lentzea flaviverrucosa]SEP98999.1 hypothetical protein SAMN05216195_101748 [Lentzea flaviverrucosa]
MTTPLGSRARTRRLRTAIGDVPLPESKVDPRIPASVLIADAQAQGAADARRHVLDSWSFGEPTAPHSAEYDPSYVLSLRHLRDCAVHSALERHVEANARTAHLREQSEEAGSFMDSARTAMNNLAVLRARTREPMADTVEAQADLDAARDVPDGDDPVWEGETVPVRLVWRLLVLLLLVVAQTPVHHLVFGHFLEDRTAPASIWALCASMAVFLVATPHVAAFMARSRQATGSERRLTAGVLLTMTFWVAVVTVLGWMCGAVLGLQHEKLTPLHVTPVTVVLMFVGGLLVTGATSYLLGLSRRHPFQESYALHRQRREQVEAERRLLIARLCPEHAAGGDEDDVGPEPLVRAIRSAYAAAEEAYFASLTQAVGDPSFTEAVQHRRGLRPQPAPLPVQDAVPPVAEVAP